MATKTYNDAEIDALVAEVKAEFLDPLVKEAKEELAKKESHKKVEDELSSKAKSNMADNFPVSKEESSMSKVAKEEAPGSGDKAKVPPTMEEQSGGDKPLDAIPPTMKQGVKKDEMPAEASHQAPEKSKSGSASMPEMSGSSGSSSDSSSSSSSSEGSGEMGDMNSLKEAYAQLDDQDLHMHKAALEAAMMERQAPPAAPQAPAAPPMQEAPPPAAPQGLAMSEKESDALKKAEKEIEDLKAQLSGVVNVLENVVNRPMGRKAAVTMQEVMAKTEQDDPKAQPKKLSKSEVAEKLTKAARDPKLTAKDRDLITRHYLDGTVKLSELEHLLQ